MLLIHLKRLSTTIINSLMSDPEIVLQLLTLRDPEIAMGQQSLVDPEIAMGQQSLLDPEIAIPLSVGNLIIKRNFMEQ